MIFVISYVHSLETEEILYAQGSAQEQNEGTWT
jgi:hypothetical protein